MQFNTFNTKYTQVKMKNMANINYFYKNDSKAPVVSSTKRKENI